MFEKIYQKLQSKEGVMLFVSILLIVVIGGIVSGKILGAKNDFPATIAVSGLGEITASPDTAKFVATISHDAKTMAEAEKKVTEQGNILIATLKNAGISEKDIKTQGFNAYPKYEQKYTTMPCSPAFCPPSNPVIAGYTVSHTYEIKVKNLDKVSDIAKLITDANVSTVSGPDFVIDDIEGLKEDARKEAIVDAKDQARILARQLGVRLGKIVDFQVISDGGYPTPMYDARMMSTSNAGMEKAESPEILPGETDVKVRVQITYNIR